MGTAARGKTSGDPADALILLAIGGAAVSAAWQQRALLWQLAWEYVTARYPFVGQHPRLVVAGGVVGLVALVAILGFTVFTVARWRRRGAANPHKHVEDAGALALKPPPVMSWAVPNVAGRGVISLLSAPPGLGKGWWLWALVRAMQDGARFFGLHVTRQRILWCTEEGASFEATARRFGIKPGLVQVLRREHVGDLDWPTLVQLLRHIAWKRRCALVVIDTVRAWCPRAEKTPEEANAIMNLVRRELTKPGLGVVFVHHDRKGGGEYGEGVAGTNALVGAVDILIELKRVQGDERARRMVTSRRFEPLDLTATLSESHYVAPEVEPALPDVEVSDPAEDALPAPLRASLDVLHAADGWQTTEQHRLALGVTRQTAMQRLTDLQERGRVEREGSGTKTAPYRWRARARRESAVGLHYPPGFDDDAYRRSDHWQRVRQRALQLAEGVCEDCGQAQAVDVHHLHYRSLGHEEPGDCRALCLACHRRRHSLPGHATPAA